MKQMPFNSLPDGVVDVRFDIATGCLMAHVKDESVEPLVVGVNELPSFSVARFMPRPDRSGIGYFCPTDPSIKELVVCDESHQYDAEGFAERINEAIKEGKLKGTLLVIDSIPNWDEETDVTPDPTEDDERPTFHKDDHGDRTNQKLRVQPFYQRGRDGKPRKW